MLDAECYQALAGFRLAMRRFLAAAEAIGKTETGAAAGERLAEPHLREVLRQEPQLMRSIRRLRRLVSEDAPADG